MWVNATLDQVKEAVETLGAEHCILMSDDGQIHNPWPHESLRVFAQGLHEKGLTQKQLDTMIITNPKHLMDL